MRCQFVEWYLLLIPPSRALAKPERAEQFVAFPNFDLDYVSLVR
jgi:hypothetical protein